MSKAKIWHLLHFPYIMLVAVNNNNHMWKSDKGKRVKQQKMWRGKFVTKAERSRQKRKKGQKIKETERDKKSSEGQKGRERRVRVAAAWSYFRADSKRVVWQACHKMVY